MKKFLVIAAVSTSIAGFGARAWAADPIAPAYDWSGLYAGFNAGYAWGEAEATDSLATNGSAWNSLGDQFSADGDGFTGGAQAGFNWQHGALVLGLESDLNYLDVGAQGTSSLSSDTHVESDGGFLSTTRVRAGFAADRILIFGTGGLAVGDMNANVFDNVGSTVTTDETGLQLGWAAGGGVEYAWSDSASVKLEYLHYDLGTEKVGGICCGGGVTQFFKIKNTGDLVRLGVNFHF